jgi:hypothetical protein
VSAAGPLRGPGQRRRLRRHPLPCARSGYGAAPPASRVLRIALRATALRAALDPGDRYGPAGRKPAGRPRPALARARAQGSEHPLLTKITTIDVSTV